MQWEVRAEPADISIHALHEESDTTANAMLRMLKFQSTLSMRRATDEHHHAGADDRISIHALHEESDPPRPADSRSNRISIHALHEESDHVRWLYPFAHQFQSTLSMRRATGLGKPGNVVYNNISIHALHEESDDVDTSKLTSPDLFQSTLSMRRATQTPGCVRLTGRHFNPRSP